MPIRNPLLLLQLYNHLTSAFILSLHLIFFFILTSQCGFFLWHHVSFLLEGDGSARPVRRSPNFAKTLVFFLQNSFADSLSAPR